MRRRLDKTWADYVAIGISPALIMLLVGSLMFFLLLAGYSGGLDNRLQWTMGWFVVAIVGIGRISMEEGADKAVVYGLALTGAMALAVMKFIEQPVAAWLVLAVVWWSAHKLTWDCTLIDEQEDASGEGLLQVAGLDEEADAVSGPAQQPPQVQPADTSLWRRMFGRRRETKKNSPPGLWVVYFSLAALPLFGLGQRFIPADDLEARRAAFWYLVIYVGSALGLLLSTAFLGLRRYLRQRKLQMPQAMTGLWIGSGAALVVLVLAVCAVIPRPSPEYAAGSFTGKLTSGEQEASQYAVLRDSGVEDSSGASGESSGESGGEGSQGEGSQGQGSQGQGSKGEGSQGEGSQGQSSQGEGSQGQGSQGQGSQGQGSQGQSSQGEGSQGQSSQGEGSQGQGSQGQGSQGEGSQGKQGQGSQGEGSQGEGSQGEGEQGQGQESQGQQEGSQENADAEAADSQSESTAPQEESSSESSFDWMPDFSGGLFLLGRWLLNLILILAVVFVVIRYWRQLAAGFAQLLASWRSFWQMLFGRQPRLGDEQAATEAARLPAFADFPNPFVQAVPGVRTPEEAVAYSFKALEAWGAEQGIPRRPQETPWEFADRLGTSHTAVTRPVRELATLFARLNYAQQRLPADCLSTVRTFGDAIELLQAARSAGATV